MRRATLVTLIVLLIGIALVNYLSNSLREPLTKLLSSVIEFDCLLFCLLRVAGLPTIEVHIVSDDGISQFIVVQVQLLVDEIVIFVASQLCESWDGLVVADVELGPEMAVYKVKHPLLEV